MTVHNQRGFTLLEVLAAIVLFSIAILLFSSVFVTNFKQSQSQEAQLIAINLARQAAEEWSTKSYNDLYNFVPSAQPQQEVQVDKQEVSINDRNYEETTTISLLDPIIIIKVEITSPGFQQPLAVVHSSVGQPS